MTTLHLVRHGESTWNAARRLQGQTPHPPLTARGRAQARAAAAALRGEVISTVLSSDLLRARETAEIIARALGLPVRLDPRLREQGYGVLEGRPSAAALADPGYDLLDADGRAPGGESLRDVYCRVSSLAAELITTHPEGEVVVVSHGDSVRALLAWLDGHPAHDLPWRDVANGQIITVGVHAVGYARDRRFFKITAGACSPSGPGEFGRGGM